MRFLCRGRWLVLAFVLVLALAGLVAGGSLGCGSKEKEMERGLVVNQEEAVPESGKELEMTETERQAQEEHKMEKKESKEFDESQR